MALIGKNGPPRIPNPHITKVHTINTNVINGNQMEERENSEYMMDKKVVSL